MFTDVYFLTNLFNWITLIVFYSVVQVFFISNKLEYLTKINQNCQHWTQTTQMATQKKKKKRKEKVQQRTEQTSSKDKKRES